MYESSFKCEVITPLFLSGAEPFGLPEIRAASIRGAMRYWYRALLGSLMAAIDSESLPLRQLRQLEAEVFGDTNRASPIIVLSSAGEVVRIQEFKKKKAVRIQPGYFVPSGRDYLLWSMSEFGRPNTERYRPARKYIDSGSQFNVILRLRSSSDERIIYKAIAAFWLVANLGALGSRARRGAGSIKVVIPASNTPIPFKICRSIEELREYLSSGIKECLKLVGGEGLYFDRPPKYDTLAPGAAEVWIVSDSANGWQTPEEALEGIGSKLRDFRSYRSKIGKSDHDAILKWLSERDAPPRIKRAVFGLPLPFRYSEGGPSDVIVAKGVERRASPLHIRITQIETGYVGVLTLFKSQFLEKGTNLQLKMREWEAPPPTSYSVIQDFIQSFHNKREVNL